MAVRNDYDDYGYRTKRVRSVAVRRQPAYVDEGVRYVAVRTAGSREKLVPVSEIADVYDDDIQYVKVRRSPAIRYVAVRGGDVRYVAPRTRYVAVRSNDSPCARAVALRSCLGDAETMSTRHVVLRDDDRYSADTKYVAVRDEIEEDDYDRDDVEYTRDDDYASASSYDDDDDYVTMPARTVSSVKYVDHDDAYLTASEVESPYERQVAVRTYPETYSTRTVSYAPVNSYYNDTDDQAFLDGGGATYVAYDDVEDACLKPMAYREAPTVVSTRTVSYIADDVDDYAFHGGSAGTFVEMRQPVSDVSYVSADKDDIDVDTDATYVAAVEDPVEDAEYVDAEPVSYVADAAEYVSYVPANRNMFRTVSYVPAGNYVGADTTYVAAEEYCPMDVSYVEAEPVYVAERRAVVVKEVDSSVAGLSPTAQRIAQTLGFNEGYEDGLDDAQDGDDFEPSDTGAQGYKEEYGDKDVYRGAFRSAYLEGYQSGFKELARAL
jgi:hypothetical protein